MATKTKQEKELDKALAQVTLERYTEEVQSGNALLLISQDFGKGLTDYLRVTLVYSDKNGQTVSAFLTWAVGVRFGYQIKDRNGYLFVAINGYGFSKSYDIAQNLARFYGVESIRHEIV